MGKKKGKSVYHNGGGDKPCICGHAKRVHVKKSGRCKDCECLRYNKKIY